jgi:hypothetical protein
MGLDVKLLVGVLFPSGGLVVGVCVRLKAAAQHADETIAELAQGIVVADVAVLKELTIIAKGDN